jgi:hypothetical protein
MPGHFTTLWKSRSTSTPSGQLAREAAEYYYSARAESVNNGTKSAVCLYYEHHQSINVTDGMTMTLIAAILQHKTSVVTFHMCQIAFNRKLLDIVCAKLC